MPNKKSLIFQLTLLNSQMKKVADMIEESYPVNSAELKGAAAEVFKWAADIQEEIMEEKSNAE